MAIVLKTWGEQLEEVQTAISRVLINQSYEVGGKMVRRADLDMLQRREEYLIKKLEANGNVSPSQMATNGSYAIEFSDV